MYANTTGLASIPRCNETTVSHHHTECIDDNQDWQDHWFRCFENTPHNLIRNSIVGTLLLTLSTLGTLSNLFICLTVIKFKLYKCTQEILILLLAISDFLIAAFLISTESVLFFCTNPLLEETIPFCDVYVLYYIVDSIWDILLPTSCFIVMLMSIERFLAIRFPFKSATIKRRHAVIAYVIAWIYTWTSWIAKYFSQNPGWLNTASLSIKNIIPLMVNSMVYVYIQRLVYKHSRAINRQRRSVWGQTDNSSIQQRQNRQHKSNYKKNVLFLYVAVSFFLFWLPYIGYEIAFIVNPKYFDSCTYTSHIILSCLVYLNSIGNVFIYGASSKPYRKAYRRFLESLCKRCNSKASSVNVVHDVSVLRLTERFSTNV